MAESVKSTSREGSYWTKLDLRTLKPEEELELAKKYKEKDDRDALEKLIAGNIRRVIDIAHRYWSRSAGRVDREELIQVGCIALWEAARSFDPYRGTHFSVYSQPRIKGSIIDYLHRVNFVKVTRLFWDTVKQVRSILDECIARLSMSSNSDLTVYLRDIAVELRHLSEEVKNDYHFFGQLLESIASDLEAAVIRGRKGRTLDPARLDYYSGQLTRFLSILSPPSFDNSPIPALAETEQKESHLSSEGINREKLRRAVLLEIQAIPNRTKRLALVLYYFWREVVKELKEKGAGILGAVSDQVRELTLNPDLHEEPQIKQRMIADLLGVSTARISQIVNVEGPAILRKKASRILERASSKGEDR